MREGLVGHKVRTEEGEVRGSYVYYAVEIEREEGSSSLSKLDLEGEEEEREGGYGTYV